jgi:hypothetical protein
VIAIAPPDGGFSEGVYPDGAALGWAGSAAVLSALATMPVDTRTKDSIIDSVYEITFFTFEKYINYTPFASIYN